MHPSRNVLAALSLAALALAQSPPSPCILQCTTMAASSAGCSGITDLQCVCTNVVFQTVAAECLQSTCTPAEQAAALQLQQTECAGIMGGASSAPVTRTATTTSVSFVPITNVSESHAGQSASITTTEVASLTKPINSISAAPAASSSASSAMGYINIDHVVALVGALVGGILAF